jgi:hypothetical protein
LIDGHARLDVALDSDVPVLVLDVTESEADKLLATLDPIAAMAGANKDALAELLADIETDREALAKMLEGLKADNGLILDDGREFDESIADDLELFITRCV